MMLVALPFTLTTSGAKIMNKFNYVHVVQGNYGQGWEDLSECNNFIGAAYDLREYKQAHPNYPHRRIERRVLNEEFVQSLD